MTGQAFYGCLQRIPFHPSFKALHIKLTLNRRKQDYTKNVSVQFNTRKKKKIKAESPDWRRAYICLPTAQQVRCATDWATGGLLQEVNNNIGCY